MVKKMILSLMLALLLLPAAALADVQVIDDAICCGRSPQTGTSLKPRQRARAL